MPSKKAALKQASEERTRQRLATRQEVAKRASETKQRKREEAMTQSASGQEPASLVAEATTERPEANVAQPKAAPERGAMVTVALRGEQAARLRALATSWKLSLAKPLVEMMNTFEATNG